MIYSYFPDYNQDFFLIHPFFHTKHIERFFWNIMVLPNKLFHAWNDYREEGDQKAENEKSGQPCQRR
ncbi:hypothetical protein HNR31_002796 [Anoxybacillus caldiproteolyticus]|uniref:Uncharacterized protein n=1 Tax=Thermaerobacillus caldiproteolyticus TaxID=247480 RepID=A0A7V9Z8N7_9BACL|nr:hypothetical protein [Anoxybacillus caldiproteolyticus]